MNCPDCRAPLRQTDYHGINIDECPSCLGRWFDRDELRKAKDRTDQYLRWLDFDLFAGDASSPAITGFARLCPRCSLKMGVVAYETSGALVDKCSICHGVWLDTFSFQARPLYERLGFKGAGRYHYRLQPARPTA